MSDVTRFASPFVIGIVRPDDFVDDADRGVGPRETDVGEAVDERGELLGLVVAGFGGRGGEWDADSTGEWLGEYLVHEPSR